MYWKRSGIDMALKMVEKTLQFMRNGGIFDHIGFGFHRYSTDSLWFVPHFEKMLYDQALLAMAYTELFQASGKNEFGKTAKEIFTYLLRDMTDSGGGFYSAEDADSEGEEGKFYLWKKNEIYKVLEKDKADLITTIFNIENSGNFIDEASGKKTGRNIIHLKKKLTEIASDMKISGNGFQLILEKSRQKLFAFRKKRVHPFKDDKILTDWNGLMIAAFAKGAQVFDNSEYAEAAKRAADFILKNLRTSNGDLLHRYRDGDASINANLDDYVFLIWGLIELYETTFDVHYLQTAIELNEVSLKNFWDDKNGGFYFTSDKNKDLLIREKEIYDGAVPSGNSVAMLNLLRLARITADIELEKKAAQISRIFSKNIKQNPTAYTMFMTAVDFSVGPSFEIAVVGKPEAEDTKSILRALRENFIPNKVVILVPEEQGLRAITKIAEFTKYYSTIDNKATVYVCQNYKCESPTTDVKKMLELLNVKRND